MTFLNEYIAIDEGKLLAKNAFLTKIAGRPLAFKLIIYQFHVATCNLFTVQFSF